MNRSPLSRFFVAALGGSDRFRKNFLSVASANVAAQFLGIVALPLLTRLFSPNDFGVMAIYSACQSVLLAAATGRFEWSVPSAQNSSRASALLALALVTLGLSCLIVLAAATFFGANLAGRIGFPPENQALLLLLPLGILGGGLQLILQSWHVYLADLRIMSRSKFAQSAVTLAASLAAGLAGIGVAGLLVSYIAGFWAAVIMLMRGQAHLVQRFRALTMARIRATFRQLRGEAGSSLALGIVNVSMAMAMTILIARYYDETIVGWYSLVFRVATAPTSLVTTALVHSFWADAADLAKTDPAKLRLFYLQSMKRLALLGLLIVPVFLAGPLYVGLIFGKDWDGAGALLAAVTPYLFALIVFNPTTHLIVYGKQHWQLVCDLLTFAAMWIVFVALVRLGAEAWEAVLAASIASLCGYVLRAYAHLKANDAQIARAGVRNA